MKPTLSFFTKNIISHISLSSAAGSENSVAVVRRLLRNGHDQNRWHGNQPDPHPQAVHPHNDGPFHQNEGHRPDGPVPPQIELRPFLRCC